MKRHYVFSCCIFMGLVAILAAGCGSPAAAPTPFSQVNTTQPGKIEFVNIPAPSLSNNVLKDPDKQQIAVYLPPSYDGSDQKYPVVYHLTALGRQLGSPYGYPPIQAGMNQLLALGKTREMIVVTVAGLNSLGGSFYVNSPITGNWEDFVVQDVVGYVDSNYRTLANSASRGISGHSMGGFGAFNLAMRHPDVFGAVYSLSPSLFDPQGLSDSQMFASQEVINSVLDRIESLSRATKLTS